MLILAVSLFFIQQAVRSRAVITAYPYEVTGWAWNDKARWLSLNCYNDFEAPGQYISTCAASNYKLQIAQNGQLSGCIWAGNNLSGGTSPLGWVCFNDNFSAYRSTPSGMGVATSSLYLNALASTTFASIISFEDWRCVGGTNNGLRCNPRTTFCSAASGVCTFTNDDKWKLGFPLSKPAQQDSDNPTPANPIQGCFNCYQQYTYVCSATLASCDPAVGCPPVGTPPTPQDCVVYSVEDKCDNCLEYFYYPGYCWSPTTATSTNMGCADFTVNQTDCCKSNLDCNQNNNETCKPLLSLIVHYSSYSDEYDCTHWDPADSGNACSFCAGVNYDCNYRDLGSSRKVLGAYNCSSCTVEDYNNRCDLNVREANLNSCGTCADTFYYPGVMIDNKHYNLDSASGERAYMCGWAWNGWDSDLASSTNPIEGLFWVQFSPRVVTSTKPYLSVESGNIYSNKGISGNYLPPFGHYNSSYLIESGGSITNFVSSSTLSGLYQGELPYQPLISFLNPDASFSKYSNALGTIDYLGLVTDVDSNPATYVNKYGSTIIRTSAPDNTTILFNLSDPLETRSMVHYHSGDLNINSAFPLTHYIFPGTGNENAAKVVVVNGNLLIGDNFEYQSAVSYNNFKNIPSLVWIVRGDLTIDADVSNLVGTFIVLGDGKDCSATPPDIYPRDRCGQVHTCVDTNIGSPVDCRDFSLSVRGSVLARYFDLGRQFASSANPQPAEQFINDGRLQINPPAGFEDFSNVIPRFTEN